MKYKNSFFRLETKEDGTYLDLYPALSDGKSLEIKEVLTFIENKSCADYNLEAVKKALASLADKPIQVKISDTVIETYSESANIIIAPDNMLATIRFYPPSNGGQLMTKKEIYAELSRYKITYGIQENIIDLILKARQYCLNIPIARGLKPVPAMDTKIEYNFNTKPLAKPKMLEDGSVDFHNLSLFTKVNKGDILATLTPHTLGEPGYNIFGASIPPNRPKISNLKYGRNITLSKDKCTIISDVDGNVMLTDDTVFVSDTYNIETDVDTSTGDIDYEGSVVIAGNVRTGFTVRAKGDIQVNGVVEGATIIAGGNIVIKRGMLGVGKGKLIAEGDVCAQFFESSNVNAKGDVIVGSILHSHVSAGNRIIVSGRKGFIVGGEISCKNYVEVNSIGNKVETPTVIKIGFNPELYDEVKKLITEVNELNSEIGENDSYLNVYKEKIKKGIKLKPENLKQIKVYSAKIEELNGIKNTKTEKLSEIRKILEEGKRGSVKVLGNTFRGVSIFISSSMYNVKETETHRLYKIVNGEIGTVVF